VAGQIIRSGYRATALHSAKSQSQRHEAMEGFRTGQFQMLVATDIAARGLDVASISHVINYDIPETPDDYIHRVGRTGRATRNGDAMTLVTATDRDTVRNIERVLGQPLPTCKPEGFGYIEPVVSSAIPRRKRRRTMLPPPRSAATGRRSLTGRR
jgi:ATP-dependent RNA helicase RhlE